MKFRPDIEGLRALAIVPVVAFHADPSLLPGGFVGVDVFFVISGYLITAVLLDRLATDRYSLASFYAARVRRIFPALFAMLVVAVPFAVWLLSSKGLPEFGRTLSATALFYSNMHLTRTGYFEPAAELNPLLHTWSLAVEEQYYIAFPLLLALLYRHWRSGIAPVLAGVGLLSFAGSNWWLHSDPALAFYAAPSRTFELMLGSLLAVGGTTRWHALPRAVREGLAAVGLGGILLACLVFNADTPFPGPAALLPCIATALVIWSGARGDTLVGRWLSCGPMRWVGERSFSLYLWHWPALVFMRHWSVGEPTAWQTALAVALSVVLASLSLRFVETPARRAALTDRRWLLIGLACIAVMLAVAWVLNKHPLAVRHADAQQQRFERGANDVNPERRQCHGQNRKQISYEQRCRFGDPTALPRTAIWADSYGAELAVAMGERLVAQGASVAQITSSRCPPSLGLTVPGRSSCTAHNDEIFRALVADEAVSRVVIVARYDNYLPDQPDAFEAGLRRSIDGLTRAGKRVLVLEPLPIYRYPVPDALSLLYRTGRDPNRVGQPLAEYRRDHAAALAMVQRLGEMPGVTVARTSDALCGTGICAVADDGDPLYFDGNHVSLRGARRIVTHHAGVLLP